MSAAADREVARARLKNQRISAERAQTPEQAVRALGALQAQDYQQVLWAIGLRTQAATRADVERSLASAKLVRTWPLRGTLQVVPGEDVAWLLALSSERRIAASQRRSEQLGLTASVLARCERELLSALRGGKRATRTEVMQLWQRAHIATDGQRGYHALYQLAQRGLICFGPHQEKQDTFVLLDEWLPRQLQLSADEALATLATRYFESRAPATAADFAWWAGLTLKQARAGLAAARLAESAGAPPADAAMHLLPGFDEFLLGYKDRRAVLSAAHAAQIVPGGNGIFLPTLVFRAQVVGTWRVRRSAAAAELTLLPFSAFGPTARAQAARAARRYGDFLGLPAQLR